MDKMTEVLNFWFEGADDQAAINKSASPFNKWFAKSEKFDGEIRSRFEEDFKKAQKGDYKSWEEPAAGRLALILFFDQFSRNMYRGTPEMFATDSPALSLTLRSFKDFRDMQLQLIERVFLYMPLMHAEDLTVQKQSVKSFQDLAEESRLKNPQNAFYYEYTLDYAKKHHDIIARFGRFPHRNAILKRASTPEEAKFLKTSGSGF